MFQKIPKEQHQDEIAQVFCKIPRDGSNRVSIKPKNNHMANPSK